MAQRLDMTAEFLRSLYLGTVTLGHPGDLAILLSFVER
jgi:hypothetical protein